MSRPNKRPRLLRPSEISELIVTKQDCQSTSVQLREVLKVCQGCHNLNHTAKQPLVTESSSSISSCVSDEEVASESGPGEQTQQPVTLQSTCPSCPQNSVAHTYTGRPRGKEDNEASCINDGSSPLSIFLLYFAEIITLLVVETTTMIT